MVKYLLNQKEVPKQVFFRSLREDSCKVIQTSAVGNGLGVDITQFDRAKYRRSQRQLQRGHILVFCGSGNTYRRINEQA